MTWPKCSNLGSVKECI